MIRGGRWPALLVAACTWALTGCGDGFFFEPAPPASAAVAVRLAAGPLAGSQADAFDRADRIAVTLSDASGRPVASEDLAFEPAGAETRVTLEIELGSDEAIYRLRVLLRSEGAPLFVGERDVTLTLGERTEAAVTLQPVAVALRVPASLPPFTSFGETRALEGWAVMATGDTIEGAAVSWTSAAPGVVAVEPASGGGSSAVAVAEGATELIATHQGVAAVLEGRVAVEVAIEVDRVLVDPASLVLQIEESAALAAEARDRNGVPIPGRNATWTTSDGAVAEVDGSGVVTGTGPGTARIFAEVDGVTGFAEVRVDTPEPPLPPTGLSVTYAGGPRVSWSDPSGGEATFQVERAVTPPAQEPGAARQATGFEVIATLPAGSTSFTDPAPVPGLLEYRLRACNPFACSQPSATVAFAYLTPPAVHTNIAGSVTSGSAVLRGTLNPNGLPTTAYFEVDHSPAFTDPRTVPFDGLQVPGVFGPREVSFVESDLSFEATYYYRLIAFNNAGLTVGNTVSFTTDLGFGSGGARR